MGQGNLTLFDEFTSQLMGGDHDLATGGNTVKVALITTLPSASQTTPTLSDFTEVTGTGYTAGGETISTNMSVSVVSGAKWKWDTTDNPSWAQNGAGPTNVIAAVINDTTANKLIGFIDMTVDNGVTPISLQAGDIDITWNASGILSVGG